MTADLGIWEIFVMASANKSLHKKRLELAFANKIISNCVPIIQFEGLHRAKCPIIAGALPATERLCIAGPSFGMGACSPRL